MYRNGKRNRLGSIEGFSINTRKEGLNNRVFNEPISGDLPGDDLEIITSSGKTINSCGQFNTIEQIEDECRENPKCLGYTTKDNRCNGRTNIDECRAGSALPGAEERKPWCLKSTERRGRQITLNNAYGEKITFKKDGLKTVCNNEDGENCFDNPASRNFSTNNTAEYLNPIFGDLPGGDIRCNRINGLAWDPDMNIALEQAQLECANEPDCIGFTTLHKPCLNVDNQSNCRSGKYPANYSFSDRKVHCLKRNRSNLEISPQGNNPWGEMLYIKKGTDATGKFVYPNDPPKRCPEGTTEYVTGETIDGRLRRGCVSPDGEYSYL